MYRSAVFLPLEKSIVSVSIINPAYLVFARYMDFISVICYDYHFSYESSVNHHAPLYSLEEDNDYNYDAKNNIVSVHNKSESLTYQ